MSSETHYRYKSHLVEKKFMLIIGGAIYDQIVNSIDVKQALKARLEKKGYSYIEYDYELPKLDNGTFGINESLYYFLDLFLEKNMYSEYIREDMFIFA